MKSVTLTTVICLAFLAQLFVGQSAAARSFYRPPERRSMQRGYENLQANELLGDILNDVDQILNGWEVQGGPKDTKAMWLKDILENVRQRRN